MIQSIVEASYIFCNVNLIKNKTYKKTKHDEKQNKSKHLPDIIYTYVNGNNGDGLCFYARSIQARHARLYNCTTTTAVQKKKKNGHQERQVLRYLTEGTTTYLLMKTEHPDAVHITYLEVS